MKHRNWYFKDWESVEQIGANGKPKAAYVYTGRYYLLPDPPARFKTLCIATMALYCVAFVFLSLFPFQDGYDPQVASVCLLQLIPLLCFFAALRPLITAGQKLTYRRYHRIFYRLRWGAGLAFFVLLAQLIMEIRSIVLNSLSLGSVVYLAVLLLEALLMTLFALYILMLKLDTTDPDRTLPLPADE